MKTIPLLKPGESLTLWDTELANEVIGACNRFLGMVVDPPLFLDKGETRWLLTYDPDRAAKIPPGNDDNGSAAFYNTSQSFTASCPAGLTGSSVTVTIAAGTIGSSISVADANAHALALATAQATAALVCTVGGNIGTDNTIDAIRIDSAGRVAISGSFNYYNGYFRPNVALLNSDLSLCPGSFYSNFAAAGFSTDISINSSGFYSCGQMTIAGNTNLGSGSPQVYNGVVKWFISGDADPSFATGTGFNFGGLDNCDACCVDGSYVLVASGGCVDYNGTHVSGLVRLDSIGGLHTNFPFTDSSGTQVDGAPFFGQIVIDGNGNKNLIAFIGTGGITGFKYSGTAIANNYFCRLTNADAYDAGFSESAYTFPSGGDPRRFCMDGTSAYYFFGGFTAYGGNAVQGVVKTDASGIFQSAFVPILGPLPFGGGTIAYDGVVDANGKLIVVGNFSTVNGTSTPGGIARINTNGSLDTSFVAPALNVGGLAMRVALCANGNIIAAGTFTTVNGTPRGNIAMFSPNGTLL